MAPSHKVSRGRRQCCSGEHDNTDRTALLELLAQIKSEYDPKDIFHCNLNILLG